MLYGGVPTDVVAGMAATVACHHLETTLVMTVGSRLFTATTAREDSLRGRWWANVRSRIHALLAPWAVVLTVAVSAVSVVLLQSGIFGVAHREHHDYTRPLDAPLFEQRAKG